nr:PKD-like family lipoprotein [uncultured Chitinophaga sp.]
MKDKTSSEYTSISAITVKQPTESLVILKKDMPDTFHPQINYGKKEGTVIDTGAYQYRWYVWGNGVDKRLLLPDNKPYLTAATLLKAGYEGKMAITFEVCEKATGITASLKTSLLTLETATECWVLLYEKNGDSKLGILAYNATGYTPLMNISDSLGMAPYLRGKPVSLAQVKLGSSGSNDSYVGVSTDQTVFLLNKAFGPAQGLVTATWINKVFHSSPAQPVYFFEGDPGGCWQNGDIYRMMGWDLEVGKSPLSNSTPLNIQPSPEGSYKVSPVGISGGRYGYWTIFDETNGRFRFDGSEGWKPIEFNPAYDLKGYKLLYGRSAVYSFVEIVGAVVKNNANEFYLLVFQRNGRLKNAIRIMDPRVAQARHFAIDFSTGYLLFDAPHAILGYDYNTNETIELMDLGAESVSVMKYQQNFFTKYGSNPREKIYDDITKNLVLCTYDPGKASEQAGTFRLMNVPLDRQPLKELYKMTALPVIRDITFNGYPDN